MNVQNSSNRAITLCRMGRQFGLNTSHHLDLCFMALKVVVCGPVMVHEPSAAGTREMGIAVVVVVAMAAAALVVVLVVVVVLVMVEAVVVVMVIAVAVVVVVLVVAVAMEVLICGKLASLYRNYMKWLNRCCWNF
uniref:Uncharacterized protein n=1 Tax=Octopus bimaculoides TaxID=37653 RepID=A0A0L8GY11_OCTBM